MQELLKSFPVVVEIPVIWGDMDSFQHVNNVIYFRYFESARIQYFEAVGLMDIVETIGSRPYFRINLLPLSNSPHLSGYCLCWS
jgi:acyl-CoA thioester hydrolase